MKNLFRNISVSSIELWYQTKYYFIITLCIGGFYTLFFINPLEYFHDRNEKLTQLSGETIGTILRVSPRKMISQAYDGAYTSTIGYDFEYVYNVYGSVFTAQKYLADNDMNRPTIEFLYNNLNETYINIKYSEIDNEISMINTLSTKVPEELIKRYGQEIYRYKYTTRLK